MKEMHRWHHTKLGLLTFLVIEAALSYGFVSLAINSGSLWFYLLTLLFLVGALQNLVLLVGSFVRRPHHA